jgi:hypothetical protein
MAGARYYNGPIVLSSIKSVGDRDPGLHPRAGVALAHIAKRAFMIADWYFFMFLALAMALAVAVVFLMFKQGK